MRIANIKSPWRRRAVLVVCTPLLLAGLAIIFVEPFVCAAVDAAHEAMDEFRFRMRGSVRMWQSIRRDIATLWRRDWKPE